MNIRVNDHGLQASMEFFLMAAAQLRQRRVDRSGLVEPTAGSEPATRSWRFGGGGLTSRTVRQVACFCPWAGYAVFQFSTGFVPSYVECIHVQASCSRWRR